MAKKELIRKILATILTVLGLACGLAVCLWLLLGSDVFGAELRWLMIVCTGALAVAIVGLVICKVQEIRALAEIVRFDAQRAKELAAGQPGAPAPEEKPQPAPEEDGPARPVMARVMNDTGVQDEGGQSSPFVSIATPISAQPDEDDEDAPAEQAVHRPWKPINFKAVDQQAQAEAEARRKALEQAQAAEAARRKAQAEAQRIAQEQARAEAAHQAEAALQAEAQRQAEETARLAEAQRQAEQAQAARLAQEQAEAARLAEQQAARPIQPAPQRPVDPALLEQARRVEAQRRAEQLRMAEAARLGQVRPGQVAAAEEARLAELARKAEAERIAQRNAALSTAPAVQAAGAAAVPAAAPAPSPWVNAGASAPQPQLDADELPGIPVDIPAPAPQETHKLNVKPISWPAPPPPSKLFVTGQVPVVTDEMVAAAKAAAEPQPDQWRKSN